MPKTELPKYARLTSEFVDLSTRHIRCEDDAVLHDPPPVDLPFNHMPYLLTNGRESEQVGWFISLPEDDETYEKYDPAEWGGLSKDFYDLIVDLHEHGVDYLRLDRDAAEHPDLPVFDWEETDLLRQMGIQTFEIEDDRSRQTNAFLIGGNLPIKKVRTNIRLDPDQHVEESED